LILFGWDFDDRGVLIWLVEVLDAENLRHLTLGIDGQADRSQAL